VRGAPPAQAGIDVAVNFTRKFCEGGTTSTAIGQTVDWLSSHVPDDPIDFWVYGNSKTEPAPARYREGREG